MKVLWFTNTPSNASNRYNFNYYGGGWLQGLEASVIDNTDWILYIAFRINDIKAKPIYSKRVKYIPIKLSKKNVFIKFIRKQLNIIESKDEVLNYLQIIDEVKPDIIEIFGTENGYGRIIPLINVPVCLHLQGLVSDIYKYYTFDRITTLKLFFNNSIIDTLKGNGLYFERLRMKKAGQREIEILKNTKYIFGRTKYDENFIKKISPNSEYFICNEVLRKEFYNKFKNTAKRKFKLKLFSTNSGEIYKGIDLIITTAILLKKANVKFEWRIAGVDENNRVLKIFERIYKISHKELNIILLGVVKPLKLINNLFNTDFFIHASRIDNSPNSICEAQLLGIPVIATNVGGISTLIDHDFNGWLSNPNASDLFNTIEIVRNYSKEYISVISKNSRTTALNRHDPGTIVNNLKKFYHHILKENEFLDK